MTDQPYDPYQQPRQQAWPGQQQPQQGYEGHEAYDDPYAAQQYTQQWQGQTWDARPAPSAMSGAETAYLPAQPPQPAAHPDSQPQPQWQQEPQPQPESQWRQESQPQPQWQQEPQPQPQPQWQQASQPQPQPEPQWQQRPQAPAPAAPAASPGAGYGPATLAGNARVTDAQRARLEGRSPIIEPGMQPAGLTALLGLLLAGTAAVGSYALLVPLVVLQAVTAAGWFRLNGMWPARQGIALAFLGALAADVALLVAGRANGPAAILGTLGVWVLLSLVLQLRSHADPDERMYGLMAGVASAALSIVAAGFLAASADAATVGAAAVAVAVLARALPLPTPASVVVSLLAAAGAGIAAGAMSGFGPKGALLGAGAAVCALIGHRVASYDYPSRFVHFTAGVALPLTAAAPVVYVLGRALG
ncbi:hypothetical protein ACIRPX_38340 [Streptomyces sp. NPDC101225]|uniref:hypothetical protein n=1 Tax=Streptomyces sp. NPDC101225 TaxID=3366135 RepID=UPI00381C67D8